jgi:ATP-dependent 26S proteasome regulatory subunit
VPIVIGQFLEMLDQSNTIFSSTIASSYYARILSTIDGELAPPSPWLPVALLRHSNALVDVLLPRNLLQHLPPQPNRET